MNNKEWFIQFAQQCQQWGLENQDSRMRTSFLTLLFAFQCLLPFGHKANQAVWAVTFKAFGKKSVEIKKRNRRGKKKSFFLLFLPKQVFHIQGLLVWKPFITLAHVDFFAEWKFLQDRCYFWCRLHGICCWLTTGSGCTGPWVSHQGLIRAPAQQCSHHGSVREAGMWHKSLFATKGGRWISCKMSFSSAPERSHFKYNFCI